MLKPIGESGALRSLKAGSMFTHDMNATPLQALEAARQMHRLFFDGHFRTAFDRRSLARKISGHLFAVEADHILPAISRAFFVRLRTDAYQRAASIDLETLPRLDRISIGYDEIENGLRSSL